MTPKQLRSRQKFIKGTSLRDRADSLNLTRRGDNYIQEEEVYNEKFDNFFEYEEELSGLKPANSQSMTMPDREESVGFVEMEENGNKNNLFISSAIELEEIDNLKSIEASHIIMEDHEPDKSNNYMDVKGFEFIRCEYIKKDGDRCKRQAPKNSTICSIHKKIMLKKVN